MTDQTAARKDHHLDLCTDEVVEPPGNRTLLDEVSLVHCALPELGLADVDLTTQVLGKRLRAPLIITGMTGGTERAGRINRALAALAERHGIGFGVGSQRAMAERPELAASFAVRPAAPTTLILGNIGLTQAAALGVDGVRRLADAIDADAMALHLNVAQELTQPEGDRDFRGGVRLIESLTRSLGRPLLVKETGCGISGEVARRLTDLGVAAIDVSGLGGTSWVRVEQLRSEGTREEMGRLFAGWGIPTAAAVVSVRRAAGRELQLVASGGVRDGLDVAKCLALGADAAGMALPIFRALERGGEEAADRAISGIVEALRQALLLTGCATPAALRDRRVVMSGRLKDWLDAV